MATEKVSSESIQAKHDLASSVSWSWILQRFTGILLLVFLGGHLWVEHFMNTSVHVVTSRLRNGIFVVLDAGLLITVVYHGLNGLHGILQETWAVARSWWFRYLVWALGLVTMCWGMDILWAFLYRRPFLVIG